MDKLLDNDDQVIAISTIQRDKREPKAISVTTQIVSTQQDLHQWFMQENTVKSHLFDTQLLRLEANTKSMFFL